MQPNFRSIPSSPPPFYFNRIQCYSLGYSSRYVLQPSFPLCTHVPSFFSPIEAQLHCVELQVGRLSRPLLFPSSVLASFLPCGWRGLWPPRRQASLPQNRRITVGANRFWRGALLLVPRVRFYTTRFALSLPRVFERGGGKYKEKKLERKKGQE